MNRRALVNFGRPGRRRPALLCALLASVVLAGCGAPNPYDIPPRPERVPPGAPPEIPTEPESTPEAPPEAQPAPPPAPRTRDYQLSAATRSLVTQAQTQAAAGNFPVAAASIERALRIEPSNPLLWIELGKVRQAEGNFVQAESMGRKALSLAVGDAKAQASAWRLVAESLRSRGRVQQAQEAEEAARALVPR